MVRSQRDKATRGDGSGTQIQQSGASHRPTGTARSPRYFPDYGELYLGLVHHEDGLEGAQRRADMASKYVPHFGVATECGMGRVPRKEIAELIRVQTQVKTPQ
ncbi:MAG: hypothetical protein ACREN8_05735 [Candidatus Dormibacteraceae bacterium]